MTSPPHDPALPSPRDKFAWLLIAGTIATAAFAWHLSLGRGTSLPRFDPEFWKRWLPILGLGSLIATSAVGCGSLLARALPLPRLGFAATLAVRFYAGLGLVSVLMGVVHGFANPWDADSWMYGYAWVVHVPFAIYGAVATGSLCRSRDKRTEPPSRIERIAKGAMFLVLGVAFLSAMSPPIQSDGLRYHLLGPQEWASWGFMHYIPYNAFSNLPSLLGLLTTAAWPHAAVFTLLHWMCLMATVVLVGECATACARAAAPDVGRDASAAARLLALGIPVLIIVGAWPFSDIAAAGACIAIIAVGLAAFENEAPPYRTAVWMGLLAGVAVAAKISAGPMVAVISTAWLIWWVQRRGLQRTMIPAMVIFCAIALVPLLPYFVRNFVNTGNPVYPVLASVIGTGEWTAECAKLYADRAGMKGYGINPVALVLSPLSTSLFYTPRFEDQNPGPALIAVLVLAVSFAWRGKKEGAPKKLLLGVLAGTWIAWFLGYQSVRFLLVPILVATSLAGAAWAVEWRDRGHRVVLGLLPALLALPGVLWTIQWSVWSYATPPVLAAFANEDDVIARAFPTYATLMSLESEPTLEKDFGKDGARFRFSKVLYIGEHRGVYARKFTPIHSDWFDTPRILALMRENASDEGLMSAIQQPGWSSLVLVNLRESRMLLQNGAPDSYMGMRYTREEYQRLMEFIARELYPRRVVGDDVTFVADLRREPDGEPMSLELWTRRR